MKILVLNASPVKNGTVHTLLKAATEELAQEVDVEWVKVNDLEMANCVACMACRKKGECVLNKDDAHRVGRKMREADALLVGTPAYWGNMTAPLKCLFDRNVPVFLDESGGGFPKGRQKGKKAGLVTSCAAPWPFNFIFAESRGALRSVKKVLSGGGYRIAGTVTCAGSKGVKSVTDKLKRKAAAMGKKLTTGNGGQR
ncbi:MAG: flavodoxin family protein [Planctomycetota bacterium]|nr:flavodoxin family protein [Planctomycetota bacterium]